MANNGAVNVYEENVELVLKSYSLGQFIQFFNALNFDLTQFNTNNITKLVNSRKFSFQKSFGIHLKPIDNSLQIIIMLVALSDPDSMGSENSIRNKLRRCVSDVYYFDFLLRFCIPIMNDNTVIREILQTELLDATGEHIDPNAVHDNIEFIIQQNKKQFITNLNNLIEHMKEIIDSGYLQTSVLHANTIQQLKTAHGKLAYHNLTRNLFEKTKGSHRPLALISNYVGQMSRTIQGYADEDFLNRTKVNESTRAINGQSFIHRSISERYLKLIQLLSFKTNQATPHYYIPFKIHREWRMLIIFIEQD